MLQKLTVFKKFPFFDLTFSDVPQRAQHIPVHVLITKTSIGCGMKYLHFDFYELKSKQVILKIFFCV